MKSNRKSAAALFNTFLLDVLGSENTFKSVKKTEKESNKLTSSRKIKYSNETTLMELVELLKEHGKLHAEDLWKMSKHPNDIDAFYAELKQQVEVKQTIKEVKNEKGYLELA